MLEGIAELDGQVAAGIIVGRTLLILGLLIRDLDESAALGSEDIAIAYARLEEILLWGRHTPRQSQTKTRSKVYRS